MEIQEQIDVGNLHHAYIVEDIEDTFESLKTLVTGAHKNSEVYIREFNSLGIDDSRELIHLAQMRSLGTQIFMYRAHTCTREAQNALLKLFEEPPHNTHFFLCVSGVRDVLPTLLSRVWVIDPTNGKNASNFGKEFIQAAAGTRMQLLEQIIKDKDVPQAGKLLSEIEMELRKQNAHVTHTQALQHIVDVRRVLNDKGASLKVLMESVALTTPVL